MSEQDPELSEALRKELYRISWQQRLYLSLNAFALIIFSVVLFTSAQRYQDLTLWGIGVCLMLFALLQFLELDFRFTGHSVLDYFNKSQRKK